MPNPSQRHVWQLMLPRVAAAVLLGVALVACSPSADDVRAERTAREQRNIDPPSDVARATAAAVAATDADMVSAVSAANTTKPISLKFRIGDRPEVGKPLTLELVVLPDSPSRIVRVHLTFQPSEGLAVVGGHELDIGETEAVARVQRELTLQPMQPGVLSLTATVLIDTVDESITRSYSIPLIALPAGSPGGN